MYLLNFQNSVIGRLFGTFIKESLNEKELPKEAPSEIYWSLADSISYEKTMFANLDDEDAIITA